MMMMKNTSAAVAEQSSLEAFIQRSLIKTLIEPEHPL